MEELEREKVQTERNLSDLQRGLEKYTDLVMTKGSQQQFGLKHHQQQKRSDQRKALSDSDAENETLFNDMSGF